LSGALIFNALDGFNLDAVENEIPTLDYCLSHPTPFGQYHYHAWSPCLRKGKGIASATEVPSRCQTNPNCQKDPLGFNLAQGWSGANKVNEEIIGISRDGHIVLGPWNANGELWDCNKHDICNGAFLADGSYAYVSTSTFPYILGCFGPAAAQNQKASCSNWGCTSSTYKAATSSNTGSSGGSSNTGSGTESTSTNTASSNLEYSVNGKTTEAEILAEL
jgi:hypothetical protein